MKVTESSDGRRSRNSAVSVAGSRPVFELGPAMAGAETTERSPRPRRALPAQIDLRVGTVDDMVGPGAAVPPALKVAAGRVAVVPGRQGDIGARRGPHPISRLEGGIGRAFRRPVPKHASRRGRG